MALEVVSSILVARPTLMGCSQEVKAPDFDSGITLVQIQPPQPLGPLAQLAEHLTFNQGVPSSNLGWTTTLYALLAQLVEQLTLNQTTLYALLAQLVEQLTLNQWAQGSSP